MAERYGFFNSVNKDRVYDASDVARFLKKYFTNGVFNNTLQVKSNDNMTISVSVGQANINGYSYELDSELTLNIAESDNVLSRIDSVILRLDLGNRQITAQILQGSYATDPSQPTITRTETIYDLRLANVSVPAGATRITDDMITDTRFGSDCGNVVGAVQQIDTTNVFKQYETYFNNWFKTLEDELSENQAGNLQNQINNLNNLVNENDNKVGDLNDLNTVDKSNVINAINELTTDYIIESGSNANGYYEKYANGTMKQWGKVIVTDELKTAHGSTGWYRTANEQFITHPIPFVGEPPVVNLMAQAALNFAYVSANNLDKTGFYPLTSYSASGATRYVHWTAVGKWK